MMTNTIWKRVKRGAGAAVAGLLAISLAACGSASGGSAAAADTSKLVIGQTQEPRSLDSAYNYEAASFPVVNQINEGLLTYGKDLKLEPGLAKSWKQVNGTTYTYEIRDNVKFSDGTPLTADDVVYTLDRNRNPETAANTQWMFANVDSVTKTGDWEVTVKLKKPDSSWQYVPATSAGQIVSKAFVEKQGKKYGKPDGGVLGTGPYKLSKWVSGSEIILERNDDYWDQKQDIPIKTIDYKIIADQNSLALAAKSGQVDYVISPSSDLISQFKSAKNLKVDAQSSLTQNFVSFNTQRAPFDDVNVRKAVSYAIDSAGIRKNAVGDLGEEATDLPFGKAMYPTLGGEELWAKFNKEHPGYEFDLDKAKEALKQTKYADGFEASLVVRPGLDAVGQAIQDSLKKIGITIKLSKPTNEEYYALIYGSKLDENGKRDYDFAINAWIPDFPDPVGTLVPEYWSQNAGQGGSNFAAYVNDNVDKDIEVQQTSSDATTRAQAVYDALAQASDDAVYKQLYYPKNYAVINTKFEYQLSPIWIYNFFVKDFKVNS